MEWEPNERDAWVADAQRWIGQIKGVLQCKIELDDDGEVSGIHVVAGFDREPRHIVRDVESLLKARLGIDVYYKKIGVVQVLDNGDDSVVLPGTASPSPEPIDPPPASGGQSPDLESPGARLAGGPGPQSDPRSRVSFHAPGFESPDDWDFSSGLAAADDPGAEPGTGSMPDHMQEPPIPAVLVTETLAPRIVCSGVGVLASESLVRAEVQLQVGSIEERGTREGPNHPDSDLVLVAEATLAAVSSLLSDKVLLHLQEIRTTTVGEQTVLLSAVSLVEGRRNELLFGVCSTLHNRQQAVVYATLDAVNRRLAQCLLLEDQAAE